MEPARLRLGQLLVDARIISQGQLEEVLHAQKDDSRRLGTLLVERGLVNETQLTQILSQQLSVPWVSLYHIDFSRRLLNLVPAEVAQKYCLVPIYVRKVRGQGDTLYVAMDDPTNEEALRECAAWSGLPTRAMIASPSDISHAVEVYYGVVRDKSVVVETGDSGGQPAAQESASVVAPVSEPPSTDSERTLAARQQVEVTEKVTSKEAVESVSAAVEPLATSVVETSAAPVAEAVPSVTEEEALTEPLPRVAMQSEADIPVEFVESTTAQPPDVVERNEPAGAPDAEHSEHAAAVAEGEETPTIDVLEEHQQPPDSSEAPFPSDAVMPKRKGFAFTLLDGTTLPLPLPRGAKKKPVHTIASTVREGSGDESPDSKPPSSKPPRIDPSEYHATGQAPALTSRDVISALRAASHGVDPADILGQNARWEALFSALLSLLLQRGVIDDDEFIEELKRV